MWNTIGCVIVASVAIAAIMEAIKYNLYDNKATQKQMTWWAVLFSAIFTPVIYYGFSLLGKPITMLLYAVIIFFMQKEIDMKSVRPMVKKIIIRKLDKI